MGCTDVMLRMSSTKFPVDTNWSVSASNNRSVIGTFLEKWSMICCRTSWDGGITQDSAGGRMGIERYTLKGAYLPDSLS